ncbi:MAG: nitrilase [Sphingomonadaceae bacterium]|nr:nitrilase [Sphingomonadaceae bacterium]
MTRVAVIQAGTTLFDTPATLAKLERLAGEAAAGGAKLAVFPEAFVGGYPKGMDFGARVGSRTGEGRDWFARYHASAIDVPGPDCDAIGEVARTHELHIVVGVIERDGGTLYCTALTFGPDGAVIAKHRKVMPTAMERIIWGQGDGSTLPVVATEIGRIGAVICWENYMPLLRTAMYGQGVELYCAPTVDDRDTWALSMRHIAFEGRCFVLSAVQFMTRDDAPADCPIAKGGTLIRGGSIIAGPLGEVLAGPVYDKEAALFADVDVAALPRAKYDFDAIGHYARPDIFTLHVDRRPKPPVTFGEN